jgi:hypothetical protein
MTTDQTFTPPWLDSGAQGQSSSPARVDEQVVAAYLAHIEQTLEARLDQRIDERMADVQASPSVCRGYTRRLVSSLAVGIPLTAVSAGIASGHGHSDAALAAVIAVMFGIIGLNVFYTVAELIALSMENGRRPRRP